MKLAEFLKNLTPTVNVAFTDADLWRMKRQTLTLDPYSDRIWWLCYTGGHLADMVLICLFG